MPLVAGSYHDGETRQTLNAVDIAARRSVRPPLTGFRTGHTFLPLTSTSPARHHTPCDTRPHLPRRLLQLSPPAPLLFKLIQHAAYCGRVRWIHRPVAEWRTGALRRPCRWHCVCDRGRARPRWSAGLASAGINHEQAGSGFRARLASWTSASARPGFAANCESTVRPPPTRAICPPFRTTGFASCAHNPLRLLRARHTPGPTLSAGHERDGISNPPLDEQKGWPRQDLSRACRPQPCSDWLRSTVTACAATGPATNTTRQCGPSCFP